MSISILHFNWNSKKIDLLFNIPVIVTSRGKADCNFPWGCTKRKAYWREGHKALVNKLPNADLVIAHNSDHRVVYDQPELVVA